MAAISCVVIVCAGTFSAMNLLVPDAAIAGKNGPITTEEGNNTIVKEGRGELGENAGEESIIVDDWKKVDGVKKKYPQLLIPQYVPEGYEFSKLEIAVTELFGTYTYIYAQGENTLRIIQITGTEFEMIKNYDRTLEAENGIKIRIKEDEAKNGYFIMQEDICTIDAELPDSEYKVIVENLKR